jgi:hypothetical protein
MPQLLVRVRRSDPWIKRRRVPFAWKPGPIKMLLELKVWDGKSFRSVEPGWVIECADREAVRHVRRAVDRLMSELHNVTLEAPRHLAKDTTLEFHEGPQ